MSQQWASLFETTESKETDAAATYRHIEAVGVYFTTLPVEYSALVKFDKVAQAQTAGC